MGNILLKNQKIENIEMVIFDKDGTLIDVHYYWCSMIEFRATALVKSINIENKQRLYFDLVENMGIDLKTKKMKSCGPVGIKPRGFIIDVVFDTIRKYDKNYSRGMVEGIFNEVDKFSKTKLSEIVIVLPGALNFIKELRRANVKTSIATTDMTKRAILAMKALNFDKYFDSITGSDMVKNTKPYPDLVNHILQKNKILRKNTVVIGDSLSDLYMAKHAKCRFIGVKSGLYTDKFLNQSKNIVNNLSELSVENINL